MGVFKLGKMTFGSLFKKPETVLYPLETKPQPMGLKGHIVVDVDSCILCGMCEKSCPTDCIKVDKQKRVWAGLPFQCIQCGYCVQVCPKKCLSMDPNYWTANTVKSWREIAIPEKSNASGSTKAQDSTQTQNEAANLQSTKPKPEKEQVVKGEKAAQAASAAQDGKVAQKVEDHELEAALLLMEAAKAERVRKALISR